MEVNITDAKRHIIKTIKAGLVANFIGSPGCGKSDVVRQIAKEFNLKVIDFRLSQADPTDLSGFPTIDKITDSDIKSNKINRSYYAPPDTFPLAGDEVPDGYDGWLLFFDEMNAAPVSVQAASYKVMLDREIGKYKIHQKVAMVCAGNKATDKAIVNRLSTAMQSRLIHINLEIDYKAWLLWAYDAGIDHRITSFINFKSDLLHKFDPNHADDTFPCPRTWAFLSKLIINDAVINKKDIPLLAGTIGEGAAVEFNSFAAIYKDLPSIEDIVQRPLQTPVPNEPSTQYAVSGMVGKHSTEKNVGAIMQFVERMNIEFQIISLQGIVRGDPKMKKNTAVTDWISINAKELL